MLSELTAVFLADFGLPCIAAGGTFIGILDTPDEALSMSGVNVLSTMYLLTARTDDVQAAGVASGSALTVAGVAYVVRDVMLIDDGIFMHLSLSK